MTPTFTTHAALIKQGGVLAAGPTRSVLTTHAVSDCFAYPIRIEH